MIGRVWEKDKRKRDAGFTIMIDIKATGQRAIGKGQEQGEIN